MNRPKVVPPRGFRAAGVVEWVQFSPTPPPFVGPKKARGRRAQGIRYENKAHDFMQEIYPDHYVRSPWFKFKEVGVDRPRWCQPDALLLDVDTGNLTIIEYKYQHTSDAWWQLKWLYLPVLAAAFKPDQWSHRLCEVVKWFDPATSFPERVRLTDAIDNAIPGTIGVHIWKP